MANGLVDSTFSRMYTSKSSSTWNCVFLCYLIIFVSAYIIRDFVQVWGNYVARNPRTSASFALKMCLLFINMTMSDPGQLKRTFTICKRVPRKCRFIVCFVPFNSFSGSSACFRGPGTLQADKPFCEAKSTRMQSQDHILRCKPTIGITLIEFTKIPNKFNVCFIEV